MSLNDTELCNALPLDVLRHAQALVRKEYDRAKADHDAATNALGRAQDLMAIWNDQLNKYQTAIAAINPSTEV